MRTPLGLALSFVSAIAVNWAYTREHDAVSTMPAFSARRPLLFLRLLLSNRAWLMGFGTETGGWIVYVVALRLAPIALVQAVGAAGIAVLAFASAHGRPGWLAHVEKVAVVVAFAGLLLLSLSLVGSAAYDHVPEKAEVGVWIACLAGGGVLLAASGFGLARAPALGLAAGSLFAGGDICAKLIGYGGGWLLAAVPLVACYALGTSFLQAGFQHGDALRPAGLATLATNALPIAAGFVVFGERLPHGANGPLQLAAFASLVVSGTLLAHTTR
ncbi:MAG: hypothetical protein ACRDL2_14845 [Gaiellaceae bacterium]